MNIFVVGTDTGCGKTYVSCAILRELQRRRLPALGMKPVATGTVARDGVTTNEDVEALRAASGVTVPGNVMNPYLFALPASPNIAARREGRTIALDDIEKAYHECCARASIVVVEGVGGWCVPLSDEYALPDLVRLLAAPVLLVVGIRLGGINHALLSTAALAAAQVPVLGWVANFNDPELEASGEVMETIEQRVNLPRLGLVSWQGEADLDAVIERVSADIAPSSTLR